MEIRLKKQCSEERDEALRLVLNRLLNFEVGPSDPRDDEDEDIFYMDNFSCVTISPSCYEETCGTRRETLDNVDLLVLV